MHEFTGLALPKPPGWTMRLIGVSMWQIGEGTGGLVGRPAVRIGIAKEKMMNEDTFRTDIRIKNISCQTGGIIMLLGRLIQNEAGHSQGLGQEAGPTSTIKESRASRAKETKAEGQQEDILSGRRTACQVPSTELIPNTTYW